MTSEEHKRAMERQAWLRWIDDESYRGLDAGPFDRRGSRAPGRDDTAEKGDLG